MAELTRLGRSRRRGSRRSWACSCSRPELQEGLLFGRRDEPLRDVLSSSSISRGPRVSRRLFGECQPVPPLPHLCCSRVSFLEALVERRASCPRDRLLPSTEAPLGVEIQRALRAVEVVLPPPGRANRQRLLMSAKDWSITGRATLSSARDLPVLVACNGRLPPQPGAIDAETKDHGCGSAWGASSGL